MKDFKTCPQPQEEDDSKRLPRNMRNVVKRDQPSA